MSLLNSWWTSDIEFSRNNLPSKKVFVVSCSFLLQENKPWEMSRICVLLRNEGGRDWHQQPRDYCWIMLQCNYTAVDPKTRAAFLTCSSSSTSCLVFSKKEKDSQVWGSALLFVSFVTHVVFFLSDSSSKSVQFSFELQTSNSRFNNE
jgi:hypothetical protein